MRYFDLSTLSMTPTSGIAEAKIPLWWADGTSASSNSTGVNTYLGDGTTSNNPSASASKLFTLSSNWSPTLQYAFEATIYTSSASYTANAAFYDITAATGSYVSGSQVSTTSTSATVIRSAKFSLTPGHTYGVVWWESSANGDIYLSDASLIVFPS